MKYYRVYLGYDKFISVNEEQLPKVIRSKAEGATVLLPQALIDGKYISLIEPDIHKMMGWNEGYKITAEDNNYIDKEKVTQHKFFLEETINGLNNSQNRIE